MLFQGETVYSIKLTALFVRQHTFTMSGMQALLLLCKFVIMTYIPLYWYDHNTCPQQTPSVSTTQCQSYFHLPLYQIQHSPSPFMTRSLFFCTNGI